MASLKYILFILLFFIVRERIAYAQKSNDSLVLFSDLKFHSGFEKKALTKFVQEKSDTFNLFLAIDENMDDWRANACFDSYWKVFGLLNQKKFKNKHKRKQTKYIFNIIHQNYLHQYNALEYFPQIFINGRYNCVSASILYSLVFNQLGIPYKILETPIHVYLVANPGKESMIIETTNPELSNDKYTNEYKRDLIDRLESMKMITQADISSKSVDEIFYERNLKAEEADFKNLAGFEYYNKGLIKYKLNELIQAYELIQKAYFFFPDTEIRNFLYSSLIQIIQNCKFKKVTDIDYLVHLSRFNNPDQTKLITAFSEIISYFLQYTDKITYCDSLHNRLVLQIKNKELVNEISFSFYLQMSKHFVHSGKMFEYIEKAIELKQNHVEANILFTEQIEKRLDKINDYKSMIDSIIYYEKRYSYAFLNETLCDYELIAFLNRAKDFFNNNKIAEGEVYLRKFEQGAVFPIDVTRKKLIRSIESTYRTLALYYFYRNDKKKAQQVIDDGLKYVPDSRYIQTAVY